MRKEQARQEKVQLLTPVETISVEGFKSIRDKAVLAVPPLALLAGANSSGKSSAMQPLLLLKQTLEVPYDPGPLCLDGPNARFTRSEQILWNGPGGRGNGKFSIEMESGIFKFHLCFRSEAGKGMAVEEIRYWDSEWRRIRPQMAQSELIAAMSWPHENTMRKMKEMGPDTEWMLIWHRFLFMFANKRTGTVFGPPAQITVFEKQLRHLIHLPALRGNPERAYRRSGLGFGFPGLFQDYVASLLHQWKEERNPKIDQVSQSLARLGLTWKVDIKPIDDISVELQVGRLCRANRKTRDAMVSIADVGFGISQVLPVLVALIAAERGQLVYIEQPEIHLHPKALNAMAALLGDAAKRGVRLVVETHSALVLLGIQTLVAKGELDPSLVKLHWFERDKDGATQVHSGDLDKQGRFGDWPQDFGHVELAAENEYLDASLFRR